MSPFEQAFPGFVRACADLYALLLPWAMVLLVIAIIVEFWHGPPPAGDLLKLFVKLFIVILLVTNSHVLINDGQVMVQRWVEQKIPARPDNVAQRYKEKLDEAQNAPAREDRSFWDTLFSSNWFEAIIFAVLTLISWLAMAILFFIYTPRRQMFNFNRGRIVVRAPALR